MAASVISPQEERGKQEGSEDGLCGHMGAENTEHGFWEEDMARESGERTGIYYVIFTSL